MPSTRRSDVGTLQVQLSSPDHAVAPRRRLNISHLQTLLLENTRFHAGEEGNDEALVKELASYAPGDRSIFVNDAFGACHRSGATVTGLAAHMPRVFPGLLVRREVQYLSTHLQHPARCGTHLQHTHSASVRTDCTPANWLPVVNAVAPLTSLSARSAGPQQLCADHSPSSLVAQRSQTRLASCGR